MKSRRMTLASRTERKLGFFDGRNTRVRDEGWPNAYDWNQFATGSHQQESLRRLERYNQGFMMGRYRI
jgi:hypothetical protein